ncbi:RnfABCDGE type electron transport complex subunit C [Myroides sp. NP-2]|uniref:RnfABCDGE type electron transport complex subunit C n=1 Tax=Myroides sp. NP-2 TaxID=2759945 RepID=UPI0015FB142A|nr:RnfABCDGE type electron transport complex subunit C [Myroides sp. NP-2]MBB1149339.1 RnfABCDGE type electron transport complex subunit C [Myroides sp. NP-2]
MVLIPSFKKKTRGSAIAPIADAALFYLPLQAYRHVMHPLVQQGEYVRKYQPIAKSTGSFATQLHAPVSGVVEAFTEIDGQAVLLLRNDFKDAEVPLQPVEHKSLTLEGFCDILLQAGIVGAGGSQFPTHLKYRVAQGSIDTLLLNGAECEPYLSSDFSLMQEKIEELLQAVSVIQTVLGVKRVIWAIEKQNRVLKKGIHQAAAKANMNVEVKLLPNNYPQGGELQLIRSATQKEIHKGSVPANHGIIVNNVGTIWAIYQALFEGKPAIERVVTLSGVKGTLGGNYVVKVGTPMEHLIQATANTWNSNTHWAIVGGAMMGKHAQSGLTPLHKGVGGVLLLKKQPQNQQNCIKCGWCIEVCPQRLMPLEFVRHNERNAVDDLLNLNLLDCIECGACAYSCPSDIPLMKHIFDGKTKVVTTSIKTS